MVYRKIARGSRDDDVNNKRYAPYTLNRADDEGSEDEPSRSSFEVDDEGSETECGFGPSNLSHLYDQTDESLIADSPVNQRQSPLFEPMDTSITQPSPTHLSGSLLDPTLDGIPALDGLKKARALKAQIGTSLTILQPKKTRASRNVEDDPENQLIKTLRQDHNMGWDAIATYLNAERLKRGEPGGLTQPAVYSRFVRNGPRIAAALDEVGFDPKDYMHLRNPNRHPIAPVAASAGGGLGLGIGTAHKRNRASGNEEKELKGNTRQRRELSEQARELEQVDMTELLMGAVEKIERSFWEMVADELERSSGRFFDSKACESRFHAV